MLMMLLISAALEKVLQYLLYQDRVMLIACQRLKGKILRIELVELDIPIIFVFGDLQVDVLNSWDDIADCTVRVRFTRLSPVREYQRLMQLIKQGDLEVDGDLQLVQQLVALLDMIEFDAAELLAPWMGDVAAEYITRMIMRQVTAIQRRVRIGQELLTWGIIDEWRLVPSTFELAGFCREVDEVDQAEERQASRLEKLEAS
ncbi:MAG: ubiquinone biosynthesis accessory factor UbiJ [Sodalis sp. Fse]|nr:MAG: ubiquinone biosynthesis accessory factor UbiJ [Sodalis sp. Fse]